MHECSYAVRAFVLLACGDCPDDGLLLSLRFEEGSLLPVLLGCCGSPPLDSIISLTRDGLSRHTRSLHLRLYLFGTVPESAISRLAHLFGQNDRVCLARF